MSRALSLSTSVLLIAGLAATVALRVGVGAPRVAESQEGGLVFSSGLAMMVLAAGWRPARPRWSSILVGLAGAVVLVAGPIWLHMTATWSESQLPLSLFPDWALLIVFIAATEEIVLRGLLFDACTRFAGPVGALVISSVAFAVIHVPLYGPAALPLDLAVGMWLGGLRLLTGSVAAPATAHIVADLCAWWLV